MVCLVQLLEAAHSQYQLACRLLCFLKLLGVVKMVEPMGRELSLEIHLVVVVVVVVGPIELASRLVEVALAITEQGVDLHIVTIANCIKVITIIKEASIPSVVVIRNKD